MVPWEGVKPQGRAWRLSWLPNRTRELGNLLVRYLVFHILFLAFISGARRVWSPAVTTASVISWCISSLLGKDS